MVEDKPTHRFGQPPVVAPGHPPQPHMTEESEPSQGLADYTKAEMEAGKKANEIWEKRKKAEMDLGKKLASRFGPHKE